MRRGRGAAGGSERWTARAESLQRGRVTRLQLCEEGRALTCSELLVRLRDDEVFRAFLDATLASSPYAAYFWETPPFSRATLGRAFECVLVESPALASLRADPMPFRRALAGAGDLAVFPNLGGDATLVVPTRRGPLEAYAHLAAFVRGAPRAQRLALWQVLAGALEAHLGDAPLWVSTSGLGVAWLHVRLDERPKYVTYAPYRVG